MTGKEIFRRSEYVGKEPENFFFFFLIVIGVYEVAVKHEESACFF